MQSKVQTDYSTSNVSFVLAIISSSAIGLPFWLMLPFYLFGDLKRLKYMNTILESD